MAITKATIIEEISEISRQFDIVFSSHVLEHTPNPKQAIQKQISLTKPGGYVIGITPNGSLHRLSKTPRNYNSHWGKVHPVLLTEKFIQYIAGSRPHYVASTDHFPANINWSGDCQKVADMTSAHLFFVIRT